MLTIPAFCVEVETAIFEMWEVVPEQYPITVNPEQPFNVLWVHDPVAHNQQYWVEKFIQEYKHCDSRISEGLLILPNQPTTAWFQLVRQECVAFCILSQSLNTPLHSQIAVYFGDRPEIFYRAFWHLGCCVQEMIPGIHFGE